MSDENKKLRIALLNTYDIRGGAAQAARRLHLGMRKLGQGCQMLAMHIHAPEPSVHLIPGPMTRHDEERLEYWNREQMRKIDRHRTQLSETLFSLPVPGYDLSLHPVVENSDVINLHWVAGMVSPASIRALLRLGKPLVWTLHDQRAFTGGCHYSTGCFRYRENCRQCPQLKPKSHHIAESLLTEATKEIESDKITVVSPSRWLADCAAKSTMFRNSRVEVIPYGLDTEMFAPSPKADARAILNLPENGFYFLFGADSLFDRRKGFHVLLDAIALLREDPSFSNAMKCGQVKFLTYGWNTEERSCHGIEIHALGQIHDPSVMALAYAAADVFVCPTLEDNLPNTILESLACARPVIASDVGGVPDMIRHGENGLLVPPDDPPALRDAMARIYRERMALDGWGVAARAIIAETHTLEAQAQSYLRLYHQLSGGSEEGKDHRPPQNSIIPMLPTSWSPITCGYENIGNATVPTAHEPPCAPVSPNISWSLDDGSDFRPSWKRAQLFINSEHAQIWNRTRHLWESDTPSVAAKLYEIGYHSGRVILNIGSHSHWSSTVLLCAAMSGRDGTWLPQLYALDEDPQSFTRTHAALRAFGIEDRSLCFHGDFRKFKRKFNIVPTMVFLNSYDGRDDIRDNLRILSRLLAPGTPVVCAQGASPKVRRTIDKHVSKGYFRVIGRFDEAILLMATDACQGRARAANEAAFQQARRKSARDYADILLPADPERPWPHASGPKSLPFRPSLFSRSSWPAISIITPITSPSDGIDETMLSVIRQNYPNLQYIVLDNGADDRTYDKIAALSPYLDHVPYGPDFSASRLITAGFLHAKGSILAWLEPGEVVAPGALLAIAKAFRNPNTDLVVGITPNLPENGRTTPRMPALKNGPLPKQDPWHAEAGIGTEDDITRTKVFFRRSMFDMIKPEMCAGSASTFARILWQQSFRSSAVLKVIHKPVCHRGIAAASTPGNQGGAH